MKEKEIIKKAIEGGYSFTLDWNDVNDLVFPTLDPLFWQALAKECGWGIQIQGHKGDLHVNHIHNGNKCTELCVVHSVKYALHFYEINLTEGWEKAVEYLSELTLSK